MHMQIAIMVAVHSFICIIYSIFLSTLISVQCNYAATKSVLMIGLEA